MSYSTGLYDRERAAKINLKAFQSIWLVAKTVFPRSYRVKMDIARILVTWLF